MKELNDPKTIRSWCLYDWANSVYSLTITTAVFPIYYSSVTKDEAGGNLVDFFGWQIKNTVLYSYSLSIAFLLIALVNPLLSGIADYAGRKKNFMRFFAWVGALACALMFFYEGRADVEFGMLCFGLATIGYAGSLVFYNAYLPEIVTHDKMDIVSARGFSYGYVGSVLLLIVNLVIIQMPEVFGITDSRLPAQISFLMVGVWWFVFAAISIRGLPVDKDVKQLTVSVLGKGYAEVRTVFNAIRGNYVLFVFLLAFFFYSMGFQTIMYLASLFGEHELHMPTGKLILTLLIIQIVAVAGASVFARMSARYGNLWVIIASVVLCVVVCVVAYYVTSEYQFYGVAAVVGIIMGGLQSISRSTYSKLLPPTRDHASYFSFYELSEKVATVLGTAAYGFIEHITGSMRNSALALSAFFVLGLVLLVAVKLREPGSIQRTVAA